jgi:anti-sigma factor RsiW
MIPLRRKKSLTCQELVELVTDYLEGALSRRDRARFDAHIAGCANCRQYVEQFRETVRLTGTLRQSDVSPDAADALLAHFAEWKRDRA